MGRYAMMILTRPDRSEKVHYNTAGYPVYIRRGVLSAYPNYSAVSHWHDDVEFIAVVSGHMMYNINGGIVRLEAGDGIFVNARQLHYGFSDDRSECIFICVLLHPMLLCASHYLEQKYVVPVLLNEHLPYHLLHHNIAWERRILDQLHKMYEEASKDASELSIQSLFFDIWDALFQHQQSSEHSTVRSHHLSALKDMVSYIQEHYRENVRLVDIAAAGRVGKTTCCMIFRKFINQTPNVYLTEYRLQKSVEMLTSTDRTVAEICYEVGFSGPSYFTETFRKNLGCSPSAYRKGHIKI